VDGEQRSCHRNFKILCSGLARNSSIADIRIRDADLDRDVAFVLGEAVANNRSLRTVSLRNCKFVDESGLAVLVVGIQHSENLEELEMRSCNLSGRKADTVSASLPLMKLKSLALFDAYLSVEGLGFLCDRIAHSLDLTHLDLSRNVLTRRGIKYLVTCLQSPHQKVRKLVLCCCCLDDWCVTRLAKGLLQNKNLSSIDLSENDFRDQGAVALKGLLAKNSSVKELKVNGCRISEKRLKALSDGLRYNNSFLKSLFSETTSLAILESVDMIENLGSSSSSANKTGFTAGSRARVVSP